MNGFEYKKRYDPELGRYVKKHVHSGEIQAGGALTDIFKSVFGKTIKKAAKTTAKKALQTGATKTGEYIGKKAGDKITQLLRKNNEASQVSLPSPFSPFSQPSQFSLPSPQIPMSQDEINERVNRIISGGKFKNLIWKI